MEELILSKTVFSKETILKTVYSMQDKFVINITENEYNYTLSIRNILDNVTFDKDKFCKCLQEQQLRELLNNEFGDLRKVIYSKAFERFNIKE